MEIKDKSTFKFVNRLIKILNKEDNSIIHWDETGESFTIENIRIFTEKIIPKYFKINKFDSFIRQLNSRSFCRIAIDKNKVKISHHYFIKERNDLLKLIESKYRYNYYKSNKEKKRELKEQKERELNSHKDNEMNILNINKDIEIKEMKRNLSDKEKYQVLSIIINFQQEILNLQNQLDIYKCEIDKYQNEIEICEKEKFLLSQRLTGIKESVNITDDV